MDPNPNDPGGAPAPVPQADAPIELNQDAGSLGARPPAAASAEAVNQQRILAARPQQAVPARAAAARPQTGTPMSSVAASPKTAALLKKYEGQPIGINYDNSAEIREAVLTHVNSEYFSVLVKDKQLRFTFPLRTLLTIVEGEGGVDTGARGAPVKFKAVVKVYPLVLF